MAQPYAPRDDIRPPAFHRSVTTAGADIDVTTQCPSSPWPACQLTASIAAGGSLVIQGEDDTNATLVLPANVPVQLRGAVKRVSGTSTNGISVLLSWTSR